MMPQDNPSISTGNSGNASEGRLKAVLDNTVDGIITIDHLGNIETFNKACERIFGYTAAEVIGKNVNVLMPEPYHRQHNGYLRNYQDTGKKKIIGIGREVEGKRKDGSTFPLDLSISEVQLNDRKIYSGIVRDITERKTAERELKDMAENLSAVMNTVADGIVTIDRTGTIQTFNRAAENIFGYTASEVIGRNVNILMPEPYHTEHDGYIHNYLTTGQAKVIGLGRQVEARKKDGSTFPMELSISEMAVSSGRMFVGIIRDITALKTSEFNLKGSEARYSAILESTVDGIITIDEQGKIETFNKACENIFGYTAQEVIGKNVRTLMPPPYHDEHDGYLQNYRDTNHRKIIGIGREVEGRKKDGSTFPLDLAVSEVKVGSKRSFTGIIRDITERKKAESRQQQFIEKIAESNEDLERFAYVCSHDLQEPLRMVRSYTQKMEMYFRDKPMDEKVTKYLHYIVDGAARAQNLISDILSYSRMDFEHKQEVIDLNEILSFAKGNVMTLIEEKGVSIKSGNLPKVTGNRVLMIQLFQNLISNAIKYCKATPEVIISSQQSGHYWQIAIEDNGIGISSEYYTKVFAIFERLHKKSEYSGTGIGLAICKKIVERHGGKIWVESEEGKGSTFFFTLPQ